MTMNESLMRILGQLQPESAMPPLSPSRVRNASLSAEIDALNIPTPTSSARVDRTLIALKAGLHLFNDDLDRSHGWAQRIEDDDTGSYWHAILHRMEGDYSNAGYWFRRVGSHPAMERLQAEASDYLRSSVDLDALPQGGIRASLERIRDASSWRSSELTDAVARQESGREQEETRCVLEAIQKLEMTALLDYSIKAATPV